MTEEKEEKGKKVEEIKREAEAIGCPVQRALYYVNEFLSGPMCGRCFPCAMGIYEAKNRLENLIAGRGGEDDLRALERVARQMAIASMCKRGKDTSRFLSEWAGADIFAAHGDYLEHVRGRCPRGECAALLEYRVIPEKCTNCAKCLPACKYDAIIGEERLPYRSGYLPFEIRGTRCVKCGDCLTACPEGAIEAVDKADAAPAPVQSEEKKIA